MSLAHVSLRNRLKREGKRSLWPSLETEPSQQYGVALLPPAHLIEVHKREQTLFFFALC
jgi:hypothetical protein